MKNLVRILLTFVLCLSVIFTAVACSVASDETDDEKVNKDSDIEENEDPGEDEEEDEDVDKDKYKDNDEDEDEDEEPEQVKDIEVKIKNPKIEAGLPERMVVEKVGELDCSNTRFVKDGGIIYRNDGDKYGIATFDGSKATGENYYFCNGEGRYFIVSTSDVDDTAVESISQLNHYGLVDVNGNELIPEEYFSISVLNDKYAQVVKVEDFAESEEDMVMYVHDRLISFEVEEGDTMLTGEWYIYDIESGKIVKGASGTKSYRAYGYGDCVKYTNDEGKSVTVDENGNVIENNRSWYDSYYVVTESDKKYVYNIDDELVFASDKYSINGYEDGYFSASKYVDGEYSYVLIDKKGNVVTAEFPDYVHYYGGLIECDNALYNFDGTKVADDISQIYELDSADGVFYVHSTDKKSIISKDGTEIYSTDNSNNDITISSDTYVIFKYMDTKYYCYSYKDKDFTVQGFACAPFTAESRIEYGNSVLVDLLTGENLLEGYSSYTYSSNAPGYVYANRSGGYDIYSIKAE